MKTTNKRHKSIKPTISKIKKQKPFAESIQQIKMKQKQIVYIYKRKYLN